MNTKLLSLLVAAVPMTAAAEPSVPSKTVKPPAKTALKVSSSAFTNNGAIPADYTCDGAQTTPPLAWSNVPKNTRAVAVLVEDPDAPSGAFTHWLVTGDHREHRVLYGRPGGTAWETLPLETAMDMVAERVRRTREATWQETLPDGRTALRTMAIAHLGGATLDNEENYLLKKLYTALGIVQVENQARI